MEKLSDYAPPLLYPKHFPDPRREPRSPVSPEGTPASLLVRPLVILAVQKSHNGGGLGIQVTFHLFDLVFNLNNEHIMFFYPIQAAGQLYWHCCVVIHIVSVCY